MAASRGYARAAALAVASIVAALAFAGSAVPSSDHDARERALLVAVRAVPRPLPRLDSALSAVARTAARSGRAAVLSRARAAGVPVRAGAVDVVLRVRPGRAAAAAAAVATSGGRVEVAYRSLLQARVPPAALARLARSPAVARAEAAAPNTAESLTGEEVSTIGAATWQSKGLTGAGATVAIIDGGFGGLQDRQASGDLPASLTTVDFCAAGFASTTHGTAVAEIVHEVAPEAQLVLICAQTVPELGQASDYVKANGIPIVNRSLVDFYGRGDGSGGIDTTAGIAADAVAHGVFWVNSAGNSAQQHWSGTFVDANADGVHEFAPGDTYDDVTINPEEEVCANLRWDEWPTARDDFKVGIWSFDDGRFLASSDNDQSAGAPPYERACTTYHGAAPTHAGLVISRTSGTGTPRFDLFFVGKAKLEYAVAAGSVTEPATSPDVVAVGAACWQTGAVQPYSGRGPTIGGLTKPDLVGVDAVSSGTLGTTAGCTKGFSGTSAGAPEVAAAAALWKGMAPALTAAELRERVLRGAVDLGAPGPDDDYGAGRLSLPTTAGAALGFLGGSSTATSITLVGSANPNAIRGDALVEYGPTTAYGSRSGAVALGTGVVPVTTAPILLTGLAPGTDVHVRLVAKNPFTEAASADQVFSTNGPPVVVTQTAAPETGGNAARLTGSVNGRGLPTSAYFELGPTTAYGTVVGPVATGTTIPTARDFANVAGPLLPSTTYHYRLVATNAAGTAAGGDATVTTAAGAPPTATTGPATDVGYDRASVTALVDTRANVGTTVVVDYGPTTAYGSTSPPAAAPYSTSQTPVVVAVPGLSPSTTYHYRVRATGPFGTAVGADATFTTTEAPPPPPPPPPVPSGRGGGGGGGSGPDLELVQTPSATVAAAGDTILYRIEVRVKNAADTSGATDVLVTDTLPSGVQLVSTKVNRGPGCTGTTALQCPLDFLSGQLVGVVEVLVKVVTPGRLVNTATVSATEGDPDASNNASTATVTAPERQPATPRAPATVTVTKGVTRRGTSRRETLRGTSFGDVLAGLGGDDVLLGLGGADHLLGGNGNDRLDGGAGADVLDGGAGADRLLARDGTRDVVRCGPGRDVAVVDRRDAVSGCETVRRA